MRIRNQISMKSILLSGLLGLGLSTSAQNAQSTADGVYSEEQASRGEAIYNEACIACHGQDLGGNSNSPGLTGMSFMFLWEGKTVGELYETIRRDMPTDNPGRLPAQDYVDVVAYVLSKNAFPAGSTELSNDIDSLNQLSISPN